MYIRLVGKILIILLVISCKPECKKNEEIKPYIDKFNLYMKKYNKDIKNICYDIIDIKTEKVAGQCDGINNIIYVNKKYWDKFNKNDRELLVFHELGHCVLNRSHLIKIDKLGRPVSLMFPILLYEYDFINNYNYYIEELFTGKQ